jgi:methionine synthase II (cobalamin-independent)
MSNSLADYDADKISHEQLNREQDAACQDSIKRMEATGSPIVTDGEQRASSFATYPLTAWRDRRLRILALQHRRQTEARLAGYRS